MKCARDTNAWGSAASMRAARGALGAGGMARLLGRGPLWTGDAACLLGHGALGTGGTAHLLGRGPLGTGDAACLLGHSADWRGTFRFDVADIARGRSW